MDSMPRPNPRNAGFSLVELVTVIVLIGVLAAIAVPRMGGSGAYEERAAQERLLSALRFAQEQAMSRRQWIRVRTDGSQLDIEHCTDSEAASPSGCGGNWDPLSPPGGGGWGMEDELEDYNLRIEEESIDTLYLAGKGQRVAGDTGEADPENADFEIMKGGTVQARVCFYGRTGYAQGESCP